MISFSPVSCVSKITLRVQEDTIVGYAFQNPPYSWDVYL